MIICTSVLSDSYGNVVETVKPPRPETSSNIPRLKTWNSRPRLETSKFVHFAKLFQKNVVLTSKLNFFSNFWHFS